MIDTVSGRLWQPALSEPTAVYIPAGIFDIVLPVWLFDQEYVNGCEAPTVMDPVLSPKQIILVFEISCKENEALAATVKDDEAVHMAASVTVTVYWPDGRLVKPDTVAPFDHE